MVVLVIVVMVRVGGGWGKFAVIQRSLLVCSSKAKREVCALFWNSVGNLMQISYSSTNKIVISRLRRKCSVKTAVAILEFTKITFFNRADSQTSNVFAYPSFFIFLFFFSFFSLLFFLSLFSLLNSD